MGGLRSNPNYRAVADVLEEHGISFSVEEGGKHTLVRFEVAGHPLTKTISRTRNISARNILNSASDVRRMIREAERPPADRTEGTPVRAQSLAAQPAPAPSQTSEKDRTMQSIQMHGRREAAPNDLASEYQFEGQKIRVVEVFDNVWFVAGDAARELGYRDAADLTKSLDVDEKGTRTMRTHGGMQEVSIVSEPGLYRAIMHRRTSKRLDHAAAAKIERFQRWVYHDVLVAIRKTGGYAAPTAPADAALQQMADGVAVIARAIETIAASQELIMERLAAVETKQREAVPALADLTANGEYVTALQVISDLAEVPASRRYQGLSSWVSTELQRACSRVGVVARLLPTHPGSKWCFPHQVAATWLTGGGRAALWKRVEDHQRRRGDQRALRLVGGRSGEATAAGQG